MSKFLWNSNLERKLHIFEIVILNATWKDCKSRKKLYTKYFTYTNKFYVHEIAAVNLSKIYFLKNAKRTCKPNNRDINRDWIIFNVEELMLFCCTQMLPFIKTKRNQKWEIPRLPNISSHRRCSVKKVFSNISQNSRENTCARVSFLITSQALEHLFYRTPQNDCFCTYCASAYIRITS